MKAGFSIMIHLNHEMVVAGKSLSDRQMNHALLPTTILILFLTASANAQDSTRQFWPGTDIFVRLNPEVRLYFSSARTKEGGKDSELDLGASIDFFLKPLHKLTTLAGAKVDESKARPLMLRVGYHKLIGFDGPDENRVIIEATPRFPLKSGLVVADRSRIDLRWKEGFSWRYRNRIAFERSFTIYSYEITPYARLEVYYDSKAAKFSRTTEAFGCIFPIRKRTEIEPYYEHQNDTASSPNRQVNALGVTVTFKFSVHK